MMKSKVNVEEMIRISYNSIYKWQRRSYTENIQTNSLSWSSTTEQNTVDVGTNIENEFQYENSFVGVPLLLIQWLDIQFKICHTVCGVAYES